MKLNLTINGENKTFEVAPNDILLHVLRHEGYYSVKNGCEEGECGACTILINGRAYKSCLILAPQVEGKSITTVEGLGTIEKPHPIQEAFVKAGAVQCGYCIPGMILSTKALLDKNPDPNEDEIKTALDGNLCRCTGYVKIIEGVKMASQALGLSRPRRV